MMRKKKKAMASGKLVLVKSVRRTRSHRMKFCVLRGLGGIPNKQRREPNGYPGALLATFVRKQYPYPLHDDLLLLS